MHLSCFAAWEPRDVSSKHAINEVATKWIVDRGKLKASEMRLKIGWKESKSWLRIVRKLLRHYQIAKLDVSMPMAGIKLINSFSRFDHQ